MRGISFLALYFVAAILAHAQGPLNADYYGVHAYHLLDRYEILSGELSRQLHTSTKPYKRASAFYHAADKAENSLIGQFNKAYFIHDNSEYYFPVLNLNTPDLSEFREKEGFLSTFYKKPNALYAVNYSEQTDGKFQLVVNPVLSFQAGIDAQDSVSPYLNSRGVSLRGSIGAKVGFYTQIIENQQRFLNYQRDLIANTGVVEGTGLHKPFGQLGQDYFNARGYITFSPIREIMFQFGHDRNFIGNGYRSLILSDQAKEYPFLKVNTKVWKINYMNLFMEHVDYNMEPQGRVLARKFSALHHLSINIGKNLNIGLFENIVFDRQDSLENNRYEIQYLNPLIFYRAVEHGLNSTDNAMLGMDWKWNFKRQFSFYGQWVFDEFVKNEFFKFSENWVNKWAVQAGIKYINAFKVSNLDVQLEYNQVRPFVYSHRFKAQNWAHFNQALAHPYGANFRELITIIRYQPKPRWQAQLFFALSKQGMDSSAMTNQVGENILASNRDILSREQAPMFQGLEKNTQLGQFLLSYMPVQNLFVDLSVFYRNTQVEWLPNHQNLYFSLGLRLNANRPRIN